MLDFRMNHAAEKWRKTLPVLPARRVRTCPQVRAARCNAKSEVRARSRFKWTWLLVLSPAEFPRTRRARGFSGRGPRESIDRVWQCKLREAVPARTRARCPD